ncbi:MAG: DNA cytosine methyltransferase [Cetobacterium sp.]|uniref:DNA cytosine methyltransferase n=1 Tax=Cetobacterium sp. TaxID=2071632 RepID=UPI003F3B0713
MIKVLELFGGIGAPRKALINLGINHKHIDYVEIDMKAVNTYNNMFPREPFKQQSIVNWNLRPDILVHGSPCQDFSRAGKRLGGSGEDKTRSSLMWETLRIIRGFGAWKPRVVVWENVKGVLDKDMKHSFEKYLKEMELMGYQNSYKILNAIDFGIPQKRDRLFVVSTLYDKFDFNRVKTRELKSINNFLEKTVDEKYTIKAPSMLAKINNNGGSAFKGYLQVIDNFVWTITTYQDRCPNSGIIELENGKHRLLTERECWRLMGFDDSDFEKALKANPGREGFKNNTLYHQAGNSIVVPLLEELFTAILNQFFDIEKLREVL